MLYPSDTVTANRSHWTPDERPLRMQNLSFTYQRPAHFCNVSPFISRLLTVTQCFHQSHNSATPSTHCLEIVIASTGNDRCRITCLRDDIEEGGFRGSRLWPVEYRPRNCRLAPRIVAWVLCSLVGSYRCADRRVHRAALDSHSCCCLSSSSSSF